MLSKLIERDLGLEFRMNQRLIAKIVAVVAFIGAQRNRNLAIDYIFTLLYIQNIAVCMLDLDKKIMILPGMIVKPFVIINKKNQYLNLLSCFIRYCFFNDKLL